MTTTLNESIQTQFRTIDGLALRFAESDNRDDHALLLSRWPESVYAFEPIWSRARRNTPIWWRSICRGSAVRLAVSGRRQVEGEETVQLVEQTGGAAALFQSNVAAERDVKALMDAVVSSFGRLDYAFNNAGIEQNAQPCRTRQKKRSTKSWRSTSRACGSL